MPAVRASSPSATSPSPDPLVWYVSYGSNLAAARLGCYLAGGRPVGAARCYVGARNRSAPRESRAVWLPGGIYFAMESSVWSGGTAFYDQTLPGTAPARAYLITAGQFADVAAQEMGRPPGTDLDLTEVLTTGRAVMGPGRYETLLHAGDLDGYPLLTFTAPWRMVDVTPTVPAAAYLAMLATGLGEAHGWTPREAAAYLAGLPGTLGAWDLERLLAVCAATEPPGRPDAA